MYQRLGLRNNGMDAGFSLTCRVPGELPFLECEVPNVETAKNWTNKQHQVGR